MAEEPYDDQAFSARLLEAAMQHQALGDPCLLDAMRAPEDVVDVREMTELQVAVDLIDAINLPRKQLSQ